MSLHGRLIISIQSGTLSGAKHIFQTDQSILIGKDNACSLVLRDRGVSRRHCRIDADAQGWKILDLESTNGISVRGIPIGGVEDKSPRKAILLRSGDEITVGDVLLHLDIDLVQEDFTEVLTLKNQGKRIVEAREMPAAKAAGVPNPLLKHSQSNELAPTLPPSDPMLNAPVLTIPGNFRNYFLEKRIGSGGMGDVFLASNLIESKSLCAIKFLKPQSDQTPQDRARFLREMEITMTMNHSTLIRSIDCGEEDSQLFIVMDYCNGGNLSELLKRAGQLNIRRAVRLMDRLLSGVEHAHALGIVHRDLKPSNILLHKDATGKYQPKISDFGLAKSYLKSGESGMTVNGSVGGSWAYMPKEQLTNFRFVAPQCDVWSLGAIMYECLTLKLPRPHQKGSDPIRTILESKITSIVDVMPEVPPPLATFLTKALEKEPENRFQDAGEMRTSLRQVAQSVGVDL